MLTPEQIAKIRSDAGAPPLSVAPTQTVSLSKRLGIVKQQPKQPFGDQPSFKANLGGAETILGNVARTFGNIPSDIVGIGKTALVGPSKAITDSIDQAKNIYKEQGAVEGTKNVALGAGETAKNIFKAPGEFLIKAGDKSDTEHKLSPIQEQALKQREEIMQKLNEAHKTGKDTSHLVLALKYNQDTLDSLNATIGTKESRDNKGTETLTNIAKYPIEHPVETTIAVQQLGQMAGIEDAIHSIASPITKPVGAAAKATIKAITPDLPEYYRKQEINTFKNPTTISKPAYNEATEIAKNGKGDPAETLVRNGIRTSDVIDGKTYNTKDTVDLLRQDAIKMSNEGLRPAIEEASYYTPKTSVDDVIKSAVKEIEGSKNVTLANKSAQIKALQKEGELLKEKYPDGMNLLDLHDNRITYSMNGGFSPIGDPSVNNIAKVNRAFSKTLDNFVAKNVPEDLPYKAFQKELSSQFQAADYLNALHGKAVPRSVLQNIAKTTAKVAGAAVGNAVGGGILGTVGGYHLGGTLEGAFENMSNPVKSYFLRNLQTSNPEAFDALTKYIGDRESQKLLQLALPAPAELGTSKNPIITPAPTTYEKGVPKPDYSNSLDQSGSVNQPIIKPSINTSISNKVSQAIKKVKDIPNQEGGFIQAYKGEKDLTTKILKDLEGKTTVSKQYILDATNRGELKQVERDLIRGVLETEKGKDINVADFAKKVKAELLPLKTSQQINPRYENISLPEELRGSVKNYSENVYESPIKTSAGDVHFSGYDSSSRRAGQDNPQNYFGHTRIEDMADNKTRRVIEVQSDLYQKRNPADSVELEMRKSGEVKSQGALSPEEQKLVDTKASKLQQYNDPTAHFRMIREEIKKASQDGKSKLQFPTGETAMKIEGLGVNADNWLSVDYPNQTFRLSLDNLKVGKKIARVGEQDQWIITDVLGDGKFKAVPKSEIDTLLNTGDWGKTPQDVIKNTSNREDIQNRLSGRSEQFDISGKVDTNNPIYKFYEKDVQKYLNKFGSKKVTDNKGVTWIEVPIKKEYGKAPVEAFGKAKLNPLFIGAGVSAGAVGAKKLYDSR